MISCSIQKPQFPFSTPSISELTHKPTPTSNSILIVSNQNSLHTCRVSSRLLSTRAMAGGGGHADSVPNATMKLLFVEMGVGYDQHGQDVTAAAMRACRDAISSNSIPAFRRGSIPGVSFGEMKLQIKLGVPRPLQESVDVEKVKAVFPYGKIVGFEIADGGLICSSGVHVEEMGDKNDDCYIVNAAVYVGY